MELWIARDANSALYLYSGMPIRTLKKFFIAEYGAKSYNIDKELFSEITWENSPKKVKLILEE